MGIDDPDGQEAFKDALKEQIKQIAAPLVAARDNTQSEAIARAVQYVQYQQQAGDDDTGTIETLEEAQFPKPSRKAPQSQINAIAQKLDDAAQNAVDNNF